LDFATVAYDAGSGARLWSKRYNGPGNGLDDVDTVLTSPDGSTVVVAGSDKDVDTNTDLATIAYAA
jgi:hypothetical protein